MNLQKHLVVATVSVALVACGGSTGGEGSEATIESVAVDASGGEPSSEADGVLYVFDNPFEIDESQFDFDAPVVAPSIDLLEGGQGAVVNLAGIDHVFNQGIQCEVIDDDKMSLVADLGALRDLGPDPWLTVVYDATVPGEEPNEFGVIGAGSAWTYLPEMLDFENDGMSIEWSRDGNTVTGTANAFSRSVGESQELAFVAVC